jgi:FAD:protein FMN transferase
MKKIIILLLTMTFGIVLASCSLSTTTEDTSTENTSSTNGFANPNTNYCNIGNKPGVYLCQRVYTSYFDTTISLKLYVDETYDYDILQVFDDFEELADKYHKYLDKYNQYDGINNIYTINNTDGPVVIDQELYDAIAYALEQEDIVKVGNTSLFNIALHPILDVWHNARNNSQCRDDIELGIDYCPIPSEDLSSMTFNIDPKDIILDESNLTIDFAKEDMGIDLGGFAKGYVSEIISSHLNQYDNIKYLLNLGNSNVYAHGINNNNDTGKYYIALTEPSTDFELTTSYYKYIALESGLNLVTSGNYQRFFKNIDTEDKTIYHHIIDPRTNYPGGEAMSITVLYNDGAIADILSTALYLLTIEEGLEFVNNYPGLEAIWYKSESEIFMSENFEDYIFNPSN